MMKHFSVLFLLYLAIFALAQDDGDEELADELEDLPEVEDTGLDTSADGIITSYVFPTYSEPSFPAGKVVEAVIGFDNQNENNFRVEYIRGSLTAPTDSSYFIQNFTGALHNTTVPSGSEVTLLYRFKADPSIDPREYGLLLEVFYTSEENETFLSTVYNQTVQISDPESSLDAKMLFTGLSIVGMITLGAYVYLTGSSNKRQAAAPRARAVAEESTESVDGIDWDYIPSHMKRTSPTRRTSPPRSPKGRN
eukprot:NODE_2987_length_1073_cov_52.001953_g2741_i0.p1 GENE.NODE_2987_length_1073_cov_52.001953_g2741_i0~~NODE_2987_length_1073_cov_52.001953_g2741_i0.p1  ORF type:complete len:251 (-),score=59.86 NODE_2987_length_1073_cov_52.001953_g2741_i0:246-998(-)